MLRLPLIVTLCLLAALPAGSAHAGFFAGDALDGPSADVVALGDLDMARDGSGALAYVKRTEGVQRIFVSRFAGGVFQPPERVDAGLATDGSQPVVGASDGGRIAAAFVSAGVVHGVVRAAGGGWAPPVALAAGSDPSLDLSINGTAYVSFTSGGDVRIARLDRRSDLWTVLPQIVDVDPARAAGAGTGRSRVAISADGIGVVTWGEGGRVYARKMFGGALSTAPQDLTPATFDGRVATVADLPDIDAEDDSSYAWAVFRQTFADGGSRVLARRQRGTAFDPPVAIDAPEGEPVGAPAIEINGRGVGIGTASGALSGQPMAAILERDAFAAGARIFVPSVAGPYVRPVVAENNDGLVAAVLGAAGGPPVVRARPYSGSTATGEVTLSRPQLGPVAGELGFDAATDRASGVVVAWVQGEPGARAVVAGYLDRLPSTFSGYSSQRCCRNARPRLSWQPSFNLWGALRYDVYVNGRIVGTTTDTRLQLTTPLPGGTQRWQVVATDVRGQQRRSRTRLLRVDTIAPRLGIRYRRVRRVVSLTVRARDPDPAGQQPSGISSVTVTWGDSSRAVRAEREIRTSHRYARRGSYRLRIRTRDRAGNERVSVRTVRVR